MPSVAFLAPVLCFVADKLSAARCHISAHGHATSLAAPTCTPSCSCSPPSPSCPNPILSRKTAFPWASSPLLDAPVPL